MRRRRRVRGSGSVVTWPTAGGTGATSIETVAGALCSPRASVAV
jgi:hypothetical protein